MRRTSAADWSCTRGQRRPPTSLSFLCVSKARPVRLRKPVNSAIPRNGWSLGRTLSEAAHRGGLPETAPTAASHGGCGPNGATSFAQAPGSQDCRGRYQSFRASDCTYQRCGPCRRTLQFDRIDLSSVPKLGGASRRGVFRLPNQSRRARNRLARLAGLTGL